MFKKMSALLIAVAMLGSVVACSMPDSIFSDEGLVQQEENETDNDINIYDFSFNLNDEEYELPLSFKALTARGWQLSDAAEDASSDDGRIFTVDSVLEPGEYTGYLPVEKEQYVVGLRFHNETKSSAPLSECTVTGVKLESSSTKLPAFSIVNDIALGSRYADVVNAYGRPSFIKSYLKTTGELVTSNDVEFIDTDESTVQILYYYLNDHAGFSFELGEDGEHSDSIVTITVDNDTEAEKKYDYSKDLRHVPKAVRLYKGPNLLGKVFSDFAFKYEGNLYTLPIPVKELIDDGWVFARGSSIRVQRGTTADGVILRKGNIAVQVLVHNYDLEYAQTPINCHVVSLSASVDGPFANIMMPKGITLGSSEEDLITAFGRDYANTQMEGDDDEAVVAPVEAAGAVTRFDIPDQAGCYIEKTVGEDYTVYSYVMPDDVPTVTLPVSVTDVGDVGSGLLGPIRKHIDVYVSNVNHAAVKFYMQNCPEYVVDENEIIEQQMEEARKQEEERKKEESQNQG